MNDLKQEMHEFMVEMGVMQKAWCTKEEAQVFKQMMKEKKALPEDIKDSDDYCGTYYRWVKTDTSDDELNRLINFRQLLYIKTIKNCVAFFVALTIISLIGYFILSLIVLR